jgi:acyl dehydratase
VSGRIYKIYGLIVREKSSGYDVSFIAPAYNGDTIRAFVEGLDINVSKNCVTHDQSKNIPRILVI